MMRVGKSSRNDQAQVREQQQQQQPQPVLETAPSTRVNVRQNFNQLPSNREPTTTPAPIIVNRQNTFDEFDDVHNDVVQYGTECPPQGTGKFPYIMDCRQFLNCWKGRGYIQSCAPGTVFNSETSECDFPSKAKCGSVNDPSTAARLESPHVYRVPKRQNLNDSPPIASRSGFADPTHTQSQPEVKCPWRHSGLVEHPIYCDKFLNCANGATYIQDCGPGTVFNPLHKVCDWPHNVHCGQRIMYGDSQAQGNDGADVDGQQGQGSNHYEQNSQNNQNREGRYHGGEGQLDVRMQPESHLQVPQTHQNGHHYPIYNRPQATTPRTNPYALNIPNQNLQPPPVATTEIPRRSFGGQQNKPGDQQTANSWQVPWQEQQRPNAVTQAPLLPEPEFTPNYNRQYYNQQSAIPQTTPRNRQATTPTVDEYENQELPMSQALLMLMRPYLANAKPNNDSGIEVQRLNSLIAQMATTEDPNTQTEEVGFTPEQENMNGVVGNPELNPSGSGLNFRPPQPPHQPHHHGHHHNHGPQGHSAEWHRRHPHIPMPGHSADWHRRHPHIPMPGQSPRKHNVPATPSDDPIVVRLDERFDPIQGSECAGKFNCNNTVCIDQDQVCDGKNDCGNRMDEANCEHIGYEVRLSNEFGTSHEGRVEIKVYDQWGYVCDDKFGMRDADVLCKEMGFSLGASEVRGSSFYPANKKMKRNDHTVFMMDELDCKGDEKSLRECDFNGWGVHDCNEEEVLGVVCKLPVMSCPLDYWLCDTSQECIPTGFLCDNVPDCTDHSDENEKHCNAPVQVRLANGANALEGRVEINYRGIWGTVCDDDFHNREAQIVCNSLGFYGPAKAMKNKFGPGVGNIWLDQVSCVGNETSLQECSHWHWGEHNCGHSEDVGVQCSPGAPPPKTTTPRYGRSNDEAITYQDFQQHPRMPSMTMEKASLIQSDQCGRVQVRPRANRQNNVFKVVNGSTSIQGRHPWQAALRVRGQGKSSHWCGAVLISRFHVLTAAHCLVGFPKGAYFIRFGDHNTDIDEHTESEIFIENLYIHEDFRKGTHMANDLAMIVLKAPVRFTDYIQPVCLPQKNTMYFPGMNCTISGWGSIQSGQSSEY